MEQTVTCVLILTLQWVKAVPIVHAPWGALQGIRVQGSGGRTMHAYLGIPYAVPPVGDLRFERPLPHPGPGEGRVFEANRVMPACPQKPVLIGSARETSEDCLMLDVYVPPDDVTATATSTTTKPYAVMVFIHGGGFYSGDAYTYRPSKLVADGGVIVVVVQYRLGVLGFLSSGDGVVPENLGLWDQNLALRWVSANVGAFGGDPRQVTLFGESAGSWSVGLHLVMPRSRGLFRRAILQSGGPQSTFRFTEFFGKRTIFRELTERVGCYGPGGSSREVLRCLKDQPVDHLIRTATEYDKTSPLFSFFFPVVDGELIPADPREVAQDPALLPSLVGDVDIIVGLNQREGSIVLVTQIFGQLPSEALYTREYFTGVLDFCFIMMGLSNNTAVRETAEFFYRGAESGTTTSETLDAVEQLMGDCLMNVAITEWARYLAAAPHTGRRYLYVLDHPFACNSQGPVPGAHHIDDLLLLFDMDREFPHDSMIHALHKTFLSEEDHRLSDIMVSMWTAFAKTGDPSGLLQQAVDGGDGEWPQYTVEREEHLSLSLSPRVLSGAGPFRDRVALWLRLLPQLDSLTSSATHTHPRGAGQSRDSLNPKEDL
ncbi:acetylcholinesterase-like [Babylonia areolata]|uniref:acetylcholinesterase-like n=1 Tax=Babylonia areolata TaxID=304850 RepID=UPI003FD40A40